MLCRRPGHCIIQLGFGGAVNPPVGPEQRPGGGQGSKAPWSSHDLAVNCKNGPKFTIVVLIIELLFAYSLPVSHETDNKFWGNDSNSILILSFSLAVKTLMQDKLPFPHSFQRAEHSTVFCSHQYRKTYMQCRK